MPRYEAGCILLAQCLLPFALFNYVVTMPQMEMSTVFDSRAATWHELGKILATSSNQLLHWFHRFRFCHSSKASVIGGAGLVSGFLSFPAAIATCTAILLWLWRHLFGADHPKHESSAQEQLVQFVSILGRPELDYRTPWSVPVHYCLQHTMLHQDMLYIRCQTVTS